MNCFIHQNRGIVATCKQCNKGLCKECATVGCPDCRRKELKKIIKQRPTTIIKEIIFLFYFILVMIAFHWSGFTDFYASEWEHLFVLGSIVFLLSLAGVMTIIPLSLSLIFSSSSVSHRKFKAAQQELESLEDAVKNGKPLPRPGVKIKKKPSSKKQ